MSDIEALYIDLHADPEVGDARRRVWTTPAREEASRVARKNGTARSGMFSGYDQKRADAKLRRFD